jgi:uncharacterized protein YjiS (DUF1127 family)
MLYTKVIEGIGTARGAVQRWTTRRETVRELRALPDYLLRDIGIERADIDAVADVLIERQAEQEVARAGRRPLRATAKVAHHVA